MHGNMMAIEVGVVKSQIEGIEGDLKTKLLAAMKAAKQGGSGLCILSEDDRFRIALGATMLRIDENEKEHLEFEIRNLTSLGAMMSGIPVDVNALLSSVEESEWEPLGLVKLWREVEL